VLVLGAAGGIGKAQPLIKSTRSCRS